MAIGMNHLHRLTWLLIAFLTSIAGAVVTQPWYDRFGLWTVTQVIKPLSRAWAAALETRGDVHAFCHQFPAAKPNRTTKRMLDGLMRNAKAYETAIAAWAQQISALVKQGKQVVLVSSGAVAEGMQRLGWKKRPVEVNELQAFQASFTVPSARTTNP